MFVQGFSAVFHDPILLVMMFVGTVVGIIFGAIPGLTATIAITLCLPLTYSMETTKAISVLMSLYIGGISGGLISAILLNIPGTPSSIATTFDGAKMAQNGQASRAIGVGVLYSFFGTVFGILCLLVIAPALTKVAMKFGAFEYLSLTVFSMTMVIALAGDNFVKGLISAVLGLMICTVGMAPIDSARRFTFGVNSLSGGFNLLTLLIGVYAISEIASAAEKSQDPDAMTVRPLDKVKGFGISWKEFSGNIANFFTSAVIGVGIGILPGIGGGTAGMMAYTLQKERAKDDRFGKGCVEGIIAPETANNAVIGGAMIPLLCLGIPGDGVTAVLLGALMVHGITPGPTVFNNFGTQIYSLYAAMLFSALVMLFVEFYGKKYFVRLLRIPQHFLLPVVFMLCCVGAFGTNNRMFDVYWIVGFGVAGYLLIKAGVPIPPLVLGFILGKTMETNFRRTLQYSEGGYLNSLLSRPIAVGFLAASALAVILILNGRRKKAKQARAAT